MYVARAGRTRTTKCLTRRLAFGVHAPPASYGARRTYREARGKGQMGSDATAPPVAKRPDTRGRQGYEDATPNYNIFLRIRIRSRG